MSLNAQIIQGDDVSLVIDIKNKDGTFVNLTGVTAVTFKVKASIPGTTHIDIDLTSGVSITTIVNGVITVTLPPALTGNSNLPIGRHIFELELTDTDSPSNVSTVRGFNEQFGCLTVVPDLDN